MSSKESDCVRRKPRFQEGERILCFHGPLIYDAKCLKVRKTNGIDEYLIHYAGWNKAWDEWVTDLRVLKYNEQNLARQRELLKAHKDAKKIRCKATLAAVSGSAAAALIGATDHNAGSSKTCGVDDECGSSTSVLSDKAKLSGNQSTDSSEAGSTSSKKKKQIHVDPGVETEEEYLEKMEIKVKLPDELKPWLVDDWDLISRQKKLILLPSKVTVDNIIENYIKQKAAIKNPAATFKESAAVQTANCIKEYFNATLGSQLLYKYERLQYAEIREKFPDQPMSSIYGAAHLLRLFVILGSLIVYTQINDKTVQVLKSQLQDFLKYLLKNSSTLFSTQNYEYATAEYQRKSC